MKMVAETEVAGSEASGGLVAFGYFTAVIVFLHDKRGPLEEALRVARRVIQNLGFGCRIEGVNAVEAWLGSPPRARRSEYSPASHYHSRSLGPDTDRQHLAWPGNFARARSIPPNSPALLHAATEGGDAVPPKSACRRSWSYADLWTGQAPANRRCWG